MQDTSGKQKHKLPLTAVTKGGMQVGVTTRYLVSIATYNSQSQGRPLYAELSPVTDFREACCRQNENGECNRGGFCNFMHLRLPSKDLLSSLRAGQRLERRLNPSKNEGGGGGWEPSKREGGRGRSASPKRGGNAGEDRWTRK